jgi:CubicO group peptidase (beta-lactamase class C family)
LVEPENLAVLYRKNGQEWLPQVDYHIGHLKKDTTLNSYVPGTNAGRLGPQGGMRISASDLARFLQCLFASRPGGTSLLLAATVDQMVSEQWRFTGENGNTQDGLFQSWGLGVHRINAPDGKDQVLSGSSGMIGHAGEAYGLVSDAYFDPERKVGLVFITNGAGAGYATGKNSAFYSVEEAVFKVIEAFGELDSCTSDKE